MSAQIIKKIINLVQQIRLAEVADEDADEAAVLQASLVAMSTARLVVIVTSINQ